MKYKIIWDLKALSDYINILEYLKDQSHQTAITVNKLVLEKVKILKKTPNVFESDKLKDSPDGNFRAFLVFNYRITYQIEHEKQEIRILRVRHTSREPLGY